MTKHIILATAVIVSGATVQAQAPAANRVKPDNYYAAGNRIDISRPMDIRKHSRGWEATQAPLD
jgi:hypothetical protein